MIFMRKNITNGVTANLKYFAFTYQEVSNYKEKLLYQNKLVTTFFYKNNSPHLLLPMVTNSSTPVSLSLWLLP